ncbi:MAG TPA: nuclear transport factor 2 family protein [Myxococcota bacterium]|nr:nuclear transport factor 2 family protein [Myxococcota bacterium]
MSDTKPALEIGTRLVQLCNEEKGLEAVDELYGAGIVSIEGQGTDAMPARMEGLQAVRGKSVWWYDNHEVHSATAVGPFVGHRDDQFVVQFDLDVTPKATGERTQMREVGLYTVADGKVVQEEFLYLMG